MKKILLMAAFLVSGFSMISCTAEAIDEVAPNHTVADGEPATSPITPPPPPPPVNPIKGIN